VPAAPRSYPPDRAVTADRLGAWMIKCNPMRTTVAAGSRISGWCVNRSYRTELVRPGHRVPVLPMDLVVRPEPVPRGVLRADPRLARLEVLRLPQLGNPLAVTVDELAALADHVDSATAAGFRDTA